jgi:SAM-dependent methyltransferase
LRPGLQFVKRLLHIAFSAKYEPLTDPAGTIVCPICGFEAKKFHYGGVIEGKGVGAGLCANSMCPECRSLERHRLIYFVLKNTILERKKYSILHFAPEKCLTDILMEYFPDSDYVTADMSEGRAMVVADIQNIQFEDGRFDLIFCNHVLEHVADDRKAMSELYRILKPAGRAFLTVPFDPESDKTCEDSSITSPMRRRIHFGQKDHVRYYGMDFRDRLESAGFRVEPFKAAGLGEEIIRRHALIEQDIVWIGNK